MYLEWVGLGNNAGYSTTNERCFDVKLPHPVTQWQVKEDEKNNKWESIYTKNFTTGQFKDIIEDVDGSFLQGITEHGELWQLVNKNCYYAHPEITFKGKKYSRGLKGTFEMIKYVIKQNHIIGANFDYETILEAWEEKKSRRSARVVNENQEEFVDLIIENIDKVSSRQELLRKIKNNKKAYKAYYQNYLNNFAIVRNECKNGAVKKPIPNFDYTFYVPTAVYDWIMWVQEWLEKWDNGERPGGRPKGLVITGDSKSGKTSLITACMPFSYQKNEWNIESYETDMPVNVFDDFDVTDKDKGLTFRYFKPWFGAQDCLTATDKYKPKYDIENGKPLVWLNNFRIEDTFVHHTDQKYIMKNMIVCQLNDNEDFITPKDTRTIGGFAGWRIIKPKELYYYKSLIKKGVIENKKEFDNIDNNTPIDVEEYTTKVVEEKMAPRDFNWDNEYRLLGEVLENKYTPKEVQEINKKVDKKMDKYVEIICAPNSNAYTGRWCTFQKTNKDKGWLQDKFYEAYNRYSEKRKLEMENEQTSGPSSKIRRITEEEGSESYCTDESL